MYTNAYVEIKFQWLLNSSPFDNESKRLELRNRLSEIPGTNIPTNAIDRRPTFRLSVLKKQEMLEKFLAAFEWLIEEIKST